MYLILSPSDIYFLTGVRAHDPGEIMVLLGGEKPIVFCDARTSGLFDADRFVIMSSRYNWWDILSTHSILETDPSCLTMALREKLEKYETNFIMAPSPITEQRIIKTPEEIEKLRESQRRNKLVYESILSFLIPGVSEREIARKIQILQLEQGADGPSFPPIVAFGENSAIPHHSPTERKLQTGDIVLLDIWLVYQGYCSDMTRSHIFSGTFDSKSTQNCWKQINSLSSTAGDVQISWRSDSICSQALDSEKQELIQLLQTATSFIINWAKPGMNIADIDKKAREMLGEYEKYFTHSLGHGVGIDIHEAPWISSKSDGILREGMVITIEPGIYIAEKYGARYEEMCMVTSEGLKLL